LFFDRSQEIIRRTNALKRLQLEYFNIETQFYKDVHALEAQYGALYSKLFEKARMNDLIVAI
jgi:hypothetical protein